MKKIISKVNPAMHGHLMLEFLDGSKQMVFRGEHEAHAPKVGDTWPPDGHAHINEGVRTGALRKV